MAAPNAAKETDVHNCTGYLLFSIKGQGRNLGEHQEQKGEGSVTFILRNAGLVDQGKWQQGNNDSVREDVLRLMT